MSVLREFFLNNLGLKAISLLLAFLLWVQVASQERVQRTVTLPVELVNMPPQLEVSNDYVKSVEADIRSERGSSALDERALAVVIDLASSGPGTPLLLSCSQTRVARNAYPAGYPGCSSGNSTESRS